jgi:hypothetical protein
MEQITTTRGIKISLRNKSRLQEGINFLTLEQIKTTEETKIRLQNKSRLQKREQKLES